MTQRSNPYDDADDPKPSDNSPGGRHRNRDENRSSSKSDTPSNPNPDCGSGTVETEWKTCPVTDALLAFFDPCSDCFPHGEVRCSTIVRSRNQHASFVHLRDGATNPPASQSGNATVPSNGNGDESTVFATFNGENDGELTGGRL